MCHHFKTRIEEHIKKDNKSHIFKHLHSTATGFDSYNSLCFKIIDKANSKFDLKIGELKCTSKSFYYRFCAPLFFSVFVVLGFFGGFLFYFCFCFCFVLFCFCVSLHFLFSLFLTLIIGIFYCVNYTSLLLHLFITHLVIEFVITM